MARLLGLLASCISQWDVTTSSYSSRSGEIMTICGELTSSNDGPRCGNILCAGKIAKDEGRGNMYLSLTFLLWPISSHVRGCVILKVVPGKTIRNEIRVLRTLGAHAKILTEKSRSWGNLRSVNKPPWCWVPSPNILLSLSARVLFFYLWYTSLTLRTIKIH